SPLSDRKVKKDNLRREKPLASIPSPIPPVPTSPRSIIIATPPLEDNDLSLPSSSSRVHEINMISIATRGQKNKGKAKESTPAASPFLRLPSQSHHHLKWLFMDLPTPSLMELSIVP
ncbi:hypothetical protein KI387_031343, partial [Taxus chinensis]